MAESEEVAGGTEDVEVPYISRRRSLSAPEVSPGLSANRQANLDSITETNPSTNTISASTSSSDYEETVTRGRLRAAPQPPSIWSPEAFMAERQRREEEAAKTRKYMLNPLQYAYMESVSSGGATPSLRHADGALTNAPPSPVADRSAPRSRASSVAEPASPTSVIVINTPGGGQAPLLYHPPYLHFTHQQPVKETHLLDIDFDPISGRKSINRYEIIDQIGKGTHGKVKLGRDLMTNEYVAIKIVERQARPRLGKAPREDEKVRREIAILKKCRHPNVVRLIEVIDDPGSKKVYLVLEYVELGEIMWRRLGTRDVLRRERMRLKRELTGDRGVKVPEESEEERSRRWRRKRRKELKASRPSPPLDVSPSARTTEENPNFWSLELGGLTEEESDADDDYPSDLDDEFDSTGMFHRPQNKEVDAPYLPPLDSDSEEPMGLISSLSMLAMDTHLTPSSAALWEDFQYVPALTLENARSTFRDTVLGLEYLHFHGIIHRDIKPANLLWTKDYRVKISDFGVSYLGRGVAEDDVGDQGEQGKLGKKRDQITGRDEEIELAKTVGTPAFFAPELCFFDPSKPRPQITSAIDVWALGVTLYCLIFARCPFLADGEFELFKVIAKEELFIPSRRLRPVNNTSSLSRPSSSRTPTSSTISSTGHGRTPSNISVKSIRPPAGPRVKSLTEEQETEPIPEDLRDLLTKLLTKDPAKRITIKEVKRHPWVLAGIADPARWLEVTDPARENGGGRIEVNAEEVEGAVVAASWSTAVFGRMRSGINKLRQKMGMGGGVDGRGLHPLATKGGDGFHRRPSSSASTILEPQEAGGMNSLSLAERETAPYKPQSQVTSTTSLPAGGLNRLLGSQYPNKSTPTSPVVGPTHHHHHGPTTPRKNGGWNAQPVSPSPMKKFAANASQSSLATSLTRTASRSSHNSDFRNALSGVESPSPNPAADHKKETGGRRLSRRLSGAGSFLRRRSRSTVGGGNDGANNAGPSHSGHHQQTSLSPHRQEVRRTPSSNLSPPKDQYQSSPGSGRETIRRLPSLQSASSSIHGPIKAVATSSQLSPTVTHHSTSTSARSRRSSGGSQSVLGEFFGKAGRRLVRSLSRSRDTLRSDASNTDAAIASGTSDEEGRERGLRISMLMRARRQQKTVPEPVVSRVHVSGIKSGEGSKATSPVVSTHHNASEGYFGGAADKAGDGEGETPSTIVPANTQTTRAQQEQAHADELTAHDAREQERKRWEDGMARAYHSSPWTWEGNPCPPSPDDYVEWERLAQIEENREAEFAQKQHDENIRREIRESLQWGETPIPPPAQTTASSSNRNSYRQSRRSSMGQPTQLVSNSSEERMGHPHHPVGVGMGEGKVRQQSTTTTSSLTESNSFPSIQSMLDSSAASSVSADNGWKLTTTGATGSSTTPSSTRPTSLATTTSAAASKRNSTSTTYQPQRTHTVPPSPAVLPTNPNSAVNPDMEDDDDDDGDDEDGIFMSAASTSRRKSVATLGEIGRSKSIAVGALQHQSHKRAVSSASARAVKEATMGGRRRGVGGRPGGRRWGRRR